MSADAIAASLDTATPPSPWRRRMPLALKFAFAFIGLVTLVLVVNGAVNVWLSYEEAKSATVRVQREKAQAAAQRIDQFVSEIEQQIGWTTRAEWARVPVEQRRYDFIRLLRQSPAITELIQVDGNGKEQLKLSRLEPDSVGSGTDFSADPRFIGAIAAKTWFGPVTFRRGSEPYMTIAVAHAGRSPGATIAEVNLKLIWDIVTSIKIGESGLAFIVDSQGRLVAHPDMSLVLRETDMGAMPKIAQDIAGSSTQTRDIAVSTSLDGKSVLIASAPIARLKWFVFVQLPVSEALAPVYGALGQIGALLVLGLVLASIMGGLLARRMVIPIQRLQAGAERLGAGAVDQRIDIRTGDEIETLAGSFNRMAERIKDSYETLEAKVEARTRDLNEALEHQTATSEVLKVISRSAFDLEAVFATLLSSACRLCEADHGLILARRGDVLVERSAFRVHDDMRILLQSTVFRPGDGTIAGRVFGSGKVEHIPDSLRDPDFRPFSEATRNSDTRTWLGVPLLRDGRVEGVFTLMRVQCEPFNDRQIDLVQGFAGQALISIENVRLFEEVQARTRDLEKSLEVQKATGEVLSVISRSPDDLQPVLTAIAHTARRVCHAEDAHIYMLTDGAYRQAASTRLPDDPWHLHVASVPITLETPGSATARAARELRTVHVPDTSSDAERDLGLFSGQTPRSVVSVPLVREHAAVGVITLNRATIDPFAPRELELLTTFADQAVIAIANTTLFEQVQARTRDLEESLENQTATAEVLKVISRSAFDLQTVLNTLIDTAVRLCVGERGMIALRDGDVLVARAFHSNTPEDLREYLTAHPLTVSRESFSGRAVLLGDVVHIADACTDPDFRMFDMRQKSNHRSILCVPLMRGGEAIGVFTLSKSDRGGFTPSQVELVRTFADQAVIAIENARLFEEVQTRTRELSKSLEDLRAAQDRLVQSEKLASLGQLTAGIAHEIKNPLNFINNFSSLSGELLQELVDVLESAPLDVAVRDEVKELAGMLSGNLKKVVQHGKRADSIVKNMLLHSREGTGDHRMVSVNALVEESLNLAYHGARAERPGFNITLHKSFDPQAGEADLYPQEITRVLLNLISNGFYAAAKKKAESERAFEPALSVGTDGLPNEVIIRIRDNGTGIPDSVKAKMFNPFFTTKPAGEGTGLGLSLSHDIIVKQHGGMLEVETEPGAFTQFTITLPRKSIAEGEKAGVLT